MATLGKTRISLRLCPCGLLSARKWGVLWEEMRMDEQGTQGTLSKAVDLHQGPTEYWIRGVTGRPLGYYGGMILIY